MFIFTNSFFSGREIMSVSVKYIEKQTSVWNQWNEVSVKSIVNT